MKIKQTKHTLSGYVSSAFSRPLSLSFSLSPGESMFLILFNTVGAPFVVIGNARKNNKKKKKKSPSLISFVSERPEQKTRENPSCP